MPQDKHCSYTDDSEHEAGQHPELCDCKCATNVAHTEVKSWFSPMLRPDSSNHCNLRKHSTQSNEKQDCIFVVYCKVTGIGHLRNTTDAYDSVVGNTGYSVRRKINDNNGRRFGRRLLNEAKAVQPAENSGTTRNPN